MRMSATDPLVVAMGSTSLLFATAFVLGFVVLASAPGLLIALWKLVKCASLVSVAAHVVTSVWPAALDHPWAGAAVELGWTVATGARESAWDLTQAGFRLLVPLLLG